MSDKADMSWSKVRKFPEKNGPEFVPLVEARARINIARDERDRAVKEAGELRELLRKLTTAALIAKQNVAGLFEKLEKAGEVKG